jgi:hypothetical protein
MLEITNNQKVLLDNVDTAIDTAFTDGAGTSPVVSFPAIEGYDTITEDVQAKGRQGVLVTFAALLAKMAETRPAWLDVLPTYGFSLFNALGYQNASATIDYQGKIVMRGMLTCPSSGGGVGAVMPGGYVPLTVKNIVVATNTGPKNVTITTTGEIIVPATTLGDWISFDNVSFWPE